ncbi:DUF4163 domain-containing protein [Tsuneonella amylolytica]|uniref:DUF4163 domain-containing protein n=1 Tax=Tsuneonella amylolytica TaxID=2338327 RepID=UPI000EA9D0F5|nr:DUF4163 domain-containing protein [Tsuneonella amylolytica]
MPHHRFAAFVTLACAACSSPAEVAERTGVTVDAMASASATGAAGAAKSVKEETDVFSYELSYPAQVGAIPELAAKIEADARRSRNEMLKAAEAEKADRQENDFPFNPHSLSNKWQVVADLPDYLSLSNSFATYTGGAHGMYGLTGLIWDKKADRSFPSEELFTSAATLGSAMGDTLCRSLNAERERKGMEIAAQGADPIFPACPSLDEATVLVGSSNGKTFDRITVWYGPYVAGSYAEGAYELDFPMTAKMLNAVKPAYRAAFSAGR